MNLKILFVTLFFYSCSFAQYQKVYINSIDPYYNNKIEYQVLIDILKDIETIFEDQLGINVFDYDEYDNSSKPINILYTPPLEMKLNISKSINKLNKKEKKIKKLQNFFESKQNYIKITKAKLNSDLAILNGEIQNLNNYIKSVEKLKITSKEEYGFITKKINKMKRNINTKRDRLKQKEIKYKDFISSYNQKISIYNTLAKQYNRLSRQIEIMARNSKEVKGAAIGYKSIEFKTFQKEGKVYNQTIETNYMERIEIYGFETLDQLKTILAHEIAHLVGVGHVNSKNALMNPILQKNQVENLMLTPDDIKAFKKEFDR